MLCLMSEPSTDTALLARYEARLPRYTSYPTAPHFGPGVTANLYETWLQSLTPEAPLSLYVHVPFCDRLCLYCGCNTSVVRHERPKRAYAARLLAEIRLVAAQLGRRASVRQVHWGGGTPTSLPGDCLVSIMDCIRECFALRADATIAIEIDPTALTQDGLEALARMGVNRASLGVQDFDEQVQTAIGRAQSFAQTDHAARALRGLGITALNLDLIYGLPMQTAASVARTARQALQLRSERIAVFGYAHVPWMKKQQQLIDETTLPDASARLAQSQIISQILVDEGGYVPVGLDHFAQPQDALAKAHAAGAVHRNFQGYTDDAAMVIGFGASAIGALPQGYVQNQAGVPAYGAALDRGALPVARGITCSADDRRRRAVITSIMCNMAADIPDDLRPDAKRLAQFAADGLVQWDGKRVVVTARGRPFLRNVAALFDAYLQQASHATRHAAAV